MQGRIPRFFNSVETRLRQQIWVCRCATYADRSVKGVHGYGNMGVPRCAFFSRPASDSVDLDPRVLSVASLTPGVPPACPEGPLPPTPRSPARSPHHAFPSESELQVHRLHGECCYVVVYDNKEQRKKASLDWSNPTTWSDTDRPIGPTAD